MSENEGGDSRFMTGFLIGFVVGVLICLGAGGAFMAVTFQRQAAMRAAMQAEAEMHRAEAMRAEAMARAEADRAARALEAEKKTRQAAEKDKKKK